MTWSRFSPTSEYREKLLHDVAGRIFLVVGGHSAHKSVTTRTFVASTKGRLGLFYLAPCSPELNPDEWVWHNSKHVRVTRVAARAPEEMKAGIEKPVRRLQSCRERVLGFFCSPDLASVKG